jgi:integrase
LLLINAAIAPGTQKRYNGALNKYTTFCRVVYGTPALPPTKAIMLVFVAYMHEASLQTSTMQGIISGIRRNALLEDQPDFFVNDSMPYALSSALLGSKRLFSTSAKAAKARANKRQPATTPIVRRILDGAARCMPPNDLARFSLTVVLCFLGGFRISEILAASPNAFNPLRNLRVEDTVPGFEEGEACLIVHVEQNKTDQLAVGRHVYILDMPHDKHLCILSTWSSWLRIRLQLGLGEAVPLMVNDNGSAFSYQCYSTLLSQACAAAGISASQYTSHSLRKGGATTLSARGQGDAAIKVYGGWSQGNAAYINYVTPTAGRYFESQRCIAASKH